MVDHPVHSPHLRRGCQGRCICFVRLQIDMIDVRSRGRQHKCREQRQQWRWVLTVSSIGVSWSGRWQNRRSTYSWSRRFKEDCALQIAQ